MAAEGCLYLESQGTHSSSSLLASRPKIILNLQSNGTSAIGGWPARGSFYEHFCGGRRRPLTCTQMVCNCLYLHYWWAAEGLPLFTISRDIFHRWRAGENRYHVKSDGPRASLASGRRPPNLMLEIGHRCFCVAALAGCQILARFGRHRKVFLSLFCDPHVLIVTQLK